MRNNPDLFSKVRFFYLLVCPSIVCLCRALNENIIEKNRQQHDEIYLFLLPNKRKKKPQDPVVNTSSTAGESATNESNKRTRGAEKHHKDLNRKKMEMIKDD